MRGRTGLSRRGGGARGAAILFLAVLLAAPAPRGSAEPPVEESLLAHVNGAREARGLAPLAHDESLARAARGHAEDMARGGFLGHLGSDGSRPGARARAVGYPYRRVAENVAAGAASPEDVVREWLMSAGHRRNLLDPEVREAGAGHAVRAADGEAALPRHYWALLLGRRAGEADR